MNKKIEALKQRYEAAYQDKRAEAEKLEAMREKAIELSEACNRSMTEAIRTADSEAYNNAKIQGQKAQNDAELYTARLEQIRKQSYLPETEGDAFIDSALMLEQDINEDYLKAIEKPLEELRKLTDSYSEEITAIENIMTDWTRNICANHRTFGRTAYVDESGQMVHRSKDACPVHVVQFRGVPEADRINRFFRIVG